MWELDGSQTCHGERGFKKKNSLSALGKCCMGTRAKIEKCGCNLWLCILSDQPKSQHQGLKKMDIKDNLRCNRLSNYMIYTCYFLL